MFEDAIRTAECCSEGDVYRWRKNGWFSGQEELSRHWPSSFSNAPLQPFARPVFAVYSAACCVSKASS